MTTSRPIEHAFPLKPTFLASGQKRGRHGHHGLELNICEPRPGGACRTASTRAQPAKRCARTEECPAAKAAGNIWKASPSRGWEPRHA